MSLKLPSDFAKKIAETLNWSRVTVDEFLEFTEDKEGYFWATLRPKKNLDKPDFITLCRLTRDLGGEDYVKGARGWKIPGPFVKTQKDHAPSESTPKEQHTGSESIPNKASAAGESFPKGHEIPNVRFIPVAAITVPSFLPTRESIDSKKQGEIRESIKKHGLKYAIRVRPGPEPGTYELKDGFLRLQSVKQLGWKEVPAEVKDTSDREVVIESIITNKDRAEEDPITVAKKLDILINAFGYTQEKLAQELGIDQSAISHHIRLLRLPKEIQHYVAIHNVSFRHALLLLTIERLELQEQLAQEVVLTGLSTRELEDRIQEVQHKVPSEPKEPSKERSEGKNLEEQARAQGVCARCGAPETTHPIEGKFYCDACAELIEAEKEPSLVPGEGPSPEVEETTKTTAGTAAIGTGPEHIHRKIEGMQVGEFTCPECKQKFFIDHISASNHKLTLIREAPE